MVDDPSLFVDIAGKDPDVIQGVLQSFLRKLEVLTTQVEVLENQLGDQTRQVKVLEIQLGDQIRQVKVLEIQLGDQEKLIDDQKQIISDQASLIVELKKTITELNSNQESQVDHLTTENQHLKSQLAKYTSPHIPTSKQLYPKKRSGLPRSLTKNKRGGSKKGKSGVTWDQKEPDEVINRYVDKCLNCGKSADRTNQKVSYTKRILELPEEITVHLQEHHIHSHECDCGAVTQASDPTVEGTSLGPNFLTFVTATRYHTGGSFENISRLVEDIAGIKPSQTMLNRAIARVCDSLEPVADELATEVMNSDFIHMDETGHKLVQEGKRSQKGSKKVWVWVFATPTAAYYHVDLTRSTKAIKTAFNFIEQNKPPPKGVSDAYPAYLGSFETLQLCWAHLLRDSRDLADACGYGSLVHGRLQTMYLDIKSLRTRLLDEARIVTDEEYSSFMTSIRNLAEARLCEGVGKLQKRLNKRAELYLTCLKHPSMPPENNHAERLLKSVIVHRSNGKPLRSLRAMKQYGILLTVLTTWKLRDLPVGSTLRNWIDTQIQGAKLIEN